MRYVGAAALLCLAGVNGMLAWTMETCTGNAPDSLLGGFVTLPLNLLGMALLVWRPRPRPLFLAASLPVLFALFYTAKTLSFAMNYLVHEQGACEVITGYGPWGLNGDEPFFLKLWGSIVAVFWCGLAFAAWRAYRGRERI